MIKTYSTILVLLLIFLTTPCKGEEIIFTVVYESGNTEIKIKEYYYYKEKEFEIIASELEFVRRNLRQDTDALLNSGDVKRKTDRHESHIYLTKDETMYFKHWVIDHKIFMYPQGPEICKGQKIRKGQRYAVSRLFVNNHEISWVSACKIPDKLQLAIEQLVEICENIIESRKSLFKNIKRNGINTESKEKRK
jgi:hypothetical protein